MDESMKSMAVNCESMNNISTGEGRGCSSSGLSSLSTGERLEGSLLSVLGVGFGMLG